MNYVKVLKLPRNFLMFNYSFDALPRFLGAINVSEKLEINKIRITNSREAKKVIKDQRQWDVEIASKNDFLLRMSTFGNVLINI